MQRLFIILLTCTLVTGCVTSGPYEQRGSSQAPDQPNANSSSGVQTQAATNVESTAPAEALPAPIVRQHGSPASKALVAQAQSQMNAGNNTLAAATIERALRIESDNPLLWIQLATIRQNEGNAAQAENLARKALAMSTGDGKAQAAAWRLIAESYRARGRNPEARDADARATASGG